MKVVYTTVETSGVSVGWSGSGWVGSDLRSHSHSPNLIYLWHVYLHLILREPEKKEIIVSYLLDIV